MNNILQLRGQLQKRKNNNSFGPLNLPKSASVTSEHIKKIKEQLIKIKEYWEEEKTIGGVLVSVHYKCIVAKSNRLQLLLSDKNMHPNESIRGAKFIDGYNSYNKKIKKHVFTYFISFDAIQRSISYLENCEKIIDTYYAGKITDKDTEIINSGKYDDSILKKSNFLKAIVDANYVESFQIDRANEKITEQSIITIYKTGIKTSELLGKFGIDMINAKIIDETTLRLDPREIEILQNRASYLIAMYVKDFSKIELDNIEEAEDKIIKIASPKNEPIVGVIDTQFDESVYFHEWVDYQNKVDPNITLRQEDYFHGTAVSSIIVDGPSFNPNLEDGCGHFRVRHFGVATAGGFSSFTILKLIRDIVASNRDIKVWNLSLGSAMEIDSNFISPEAAELDRIQCEYDVIFVVAGTNNNTENKERKKIGAPADSLNSLVVNAVDFKGQSASYTRVGPVLSFFYKPDVCYYGGDITEKIVVCEPLGKATVSGTSFAAPWITRKLAYLIYVVGLSREIAKALIIDSAAGWDRQDNISYSMGYGIVPKRIEDIIYSKDDEIRFVVNGTIEEYETYTYNIPVPQNMNGYPFFAKATLAYFPGCDRNQGVDYTNTEMDLHFGRIFERNGKPAIKPINYNKQAEEGLQSIYEEDARNLYRKWDNVKHISEEIKSTSKPRKVYDAGLWGISIKTKERLLAKAGRGLQFGLVITLKEMNGVNRIDEFIKLCMARGWLVSKIDVQNQIEIYSKAEEEIEFE